MRDLSDSKSKHIIRGLLMRKFHVYVTSVILSVILLVFQSCSRNEIAVSAWKQTDGPFGGFIYCFAEKDGFIYAGSEQGGVFISGDDGNSWTEFNTGLTSRNVYALAAYEDSLIAGTSNGIYIVSGNNKEWKILNRDLSGVFTYSLLLNKGKLFAGTDGGLRIITKTSTEIYGYTTLLDNANITSLAAKGDLVFAHCFWGFYFFC